MVISDPSTLATMLLPVFAPEPCTLFAGAGTSAYAGLRTWQSYLRALADQLDKYESDLAVVMRKRIDRNQLLEAAHSYMESTDMPVGTKYQQLVLQLKTDRYDPLRLLSLVALPFEAIVTTNYDRAFLEAWAKSRGEAPYCIEKDDPTMKQGAFLSRPFIARIHGREEVPESMVLETRHYDLLEKDTAYQDFIHNLFLRKKCLFLGFSFFDPAINRVLDTIQKRGVFPKQHYALAPADATELIARLAAANIQLITYDPRDNHSLLWEAIERVRAAPPVISGDVGETRLPAFETARRLLAICYARTRMGKDVIALRNLVAQGIVISLVAGGETEIAGIREHLHEYLPVNQTESEVLIQEILAGLEAKNVITREGNILKLGMKIPSQNEMMPIRVLVDGVVSRLMVRDRYELRMEHRASLATLIEEVIVLRGWDLGAEFAGAKGDEDINLAFTIEKATSKNLSALTPDRRKQVGESVIELMRHPGEQEEAALAELGRLAFGIEVILQSGRSTMYGAVFPDTIFLDASVLMPAITPGHPYQEAYWNAIVTIREKVGSTSEVYVADVFLEEIYSHRNNAAITVDDLKLNDPENLKAFMSYFSPTNTNVFIGAYSTYVANQKTPRPFAEFMAEIAPYSKEEQLVKFLEQKGIRIAWSKGKSDQESARYADIRGALLDGYDQIEADQHADRKKRPILKQHEATQLALLEQSLDAGRRAVFVTADNKLRRAVRANRRLSQLLDSLISHRGLVQLVDLLVGLETDPSALRRLLWSVQIADPSAGIKGYLLNRALEYYDAAMLFRMGDLLDEFATKYAREAALEAVHLTKIRPEEQPKTKRFLDRIDSEFFHYMAGELKKIKAGSKK